MKLTVLSVQFSSAITLLIDHGWLFGRPHPREFIYVREQTKVKMPDVNEKRKSPGESFVFISL